MLSKCANPACTKSFRYFRDGCVFHVEREEDASPEGKPSHNVEHFWLCGDCCKSMTVLYDKEEGVRIVPRDRWRRAA